MSIFHIIAIGILIYAFVNFRKAYLIFLLFGLFLNQNISLIDIPGLPLLTLFTGLLFCFMVIYFTIVKRNRLIKQPFPFSKPFTFIGISYILSMIFSIAGIGNTLSAVVKVIVEQFFCVWLLWTVIQDRKDIRFLLKGLVIVFLFASCYGVYEYLLQSNPLGEYTLSLAGDSEKALDFSYSADRFRGYRVKSIFNHAIGSGINFSIFILTILFFLKRRTNIFKVSPLHLIILVLSLACIIFSNSRGPLVFLIISMLSIISFSEKKTYLGIFLMIILGIVFFNRIEPYVDNLISIFDSSVAKNVGGSSLEMRIGQLLAAYTMFIDAPIFGLGPKADLFYSDQNVVARLLGIESIWFRIMIERGIIGIISYCYLMCHLIIKLGKRSKSIRYISLALIITETATSIPGLPMYFFYMSIIIIIKLNSFKDM